MLDDTNLLAALAEIRRIQVVTAKLNNATQGVFDDAYAYAIAHRLYPLYQEDIGSHDEPANRGHDVTRFQDPHKRKLVTEVYPYFGTYRLSYGQVADVANLIEARMEIGKDTMTFFELVETYAREQKHIFKEATLADDLFHICRYVYLSSHEDREFWQHFASGTLPASLGALYPYGDMNPAWVIEPFGPEDLAIEPGSADVELLELDRQSTPMH